jgi:ABC-type glycerol-3-phosphate transport system permease component
MSGRLGRVGNSYSTAARASMAILLRKISFRTFLYVMLIVVVGINDLPLAWMAITSIKPSNEIVIYPPGGLPNRPTFDNYVQLFTVSNFGHYMLNSAIVAGSTTVAVTVLGTFGAYALVRFNFASVRWLGEASLLAYMVPSILLLVPLLRIMYFLHLDDNLLSLVIIYTTLLLPFGLWTLRPYFQGVSIELEQAAMVDGCTRFGAFIRVVLPQGVPGVIASAIFTFNAAWGEYLFASTLLTTAKSLTLSPGLLMLFSSADIQGWGMLMAGCVFMTMPLVLLFIIFQRQLVEAWGEGAIKS